MLRQGRLETLQRWAAVGQEGRQMVLAYRKLVVRTSRAFR